MKKFLFLINLLFLQISFGQTHIVKPDGEIIKIDKKNLGKYSNVFLQNKKPDQNFGTGVQCILYQ